MRKLINGCVRAIYKTIGPNKASKLSQNRFLQAIMEVLLAQKGDVYNCAYGIKLCMPKEEADAYGVSYLGVINPVETKFLTEYLKPGMTVLDVGTYIDGWYTILSSGLVGSTRHVYAFEPVPEFLTAMSKNLEINDCQNVTTVPACLGASEGIVSFSIDRGFSSILQKDGKANSKKQLENITMHTMDNYFITKNIKSVDFIKVDAEGAEFDILKGGTTVLAEWRPVVLLEVVLHQLEEFGSSVSDIYTYFENMNYIPFSVCRKAFVLSNKELESDTPNILFIPQEKVENIFPANTESPLV